MLLLRPAVALMQRLRLLPKFTLVSLVFLLPLLAATGLLMAELHKSIAYTAQERRGVAYIVQLQELKRLSQQRRALATLGQDVRPLAAQIDAALGKLDGWQKEAQELSALPEFQALQADWKTLRQASPDPRRGLARHTAFIARIGGLVTLVADRSKLSLDPEVQTYYLIGAFVKTIPDIAEGLSVIAARGGSYIDTGLLEANEDQLLNATAMIARHELERMPRLPPVQARQRTAIPAALAFLVRTHNEITMSYNQTSGKAFNAGGSQAIDGLYGVAQASAEVLDGLLAERAGRAALRRNLILAAVLAAIALASWLGAGFYASFSRDIARLNGAVKAAADGDLSVRIASPARDEIGSLANAFGRMTASLETLVADIRNSAGHIGGAADELAEGNASLSGHTEAQAEALAETVASMRELADTVQRNSAHARDGERLGQAASGVARRGGDSVREVVETMASIRASSDRIADIIGVIDSIAFQTNILALNAAVEAARAGEQGRGFAVVAAEVRSLAQRSAAAALEIKQLIADSVGKVESGSRLVDSAGATMAEVVDSVHRMAALIGQIGAAEAEQRAEIGSLNSALARIDGMNRQNAGLVLQASVGAGRVHEESALLNQALSRFRLSGETAGQAYVSSRTDGLGTVALPHSWSANKPRLSSREAARRHG
ncbi:methyl-accepting chemotaxis protein [Massilia endophytica]|uniref:methyl-accepting chemotaxis protein n=1 Tax=Massilia endophytica TaxID=2899220 RepID=UPI001E62628D|nr:methyl-accepting chemotaxis protein [Massilia endophytica]UGQ48917.1 methyl-accepting chemotaxis protein [Massilia endophytica]